MQDKIYSKKISIFLLLMLFLSPKAVAYDVMITGPNGEFLSGYDMPSLQRLHISPASRLYFLIQSTYSILSNRRMIASQADYHWQQLLYGLRGAPALVQDMANSLAASLLGGINSLSAIYDQGYIQALGPDGHELYPQMSGDFLDENASRSYEVLPTQIGPTCLGMSYLFCMEESEWELFDDLMSDHGLSRYRLAQTIRSDERGANLATLHERLSEMSTERGFPNPTTTSNSLERHELGYEDSTSYFRHELLNTPTLVGIVVAISARWHPRRRFDRVGHAVALMGYSREYESFIVYDPNFSFLQLMPYVYFRYLYTPEQSIDAVLFDILRHNLSGDLMLSFGSDDYPFGGSP